MNKEDLNAASYKDIKKLAKENGFNPNQKKVVLIDLILEKLNPKPLTVEDIKKGNITPEVVAEAAANEFNEDEDELDTSLKEESTPEYKLPTGNPFSKPDFVWYIDKAILRKMISRVDVNQLYVKYILSGIGDDADAMLNWALKELMKK